LTAPRLLLDEDARPLLAAALQRSGFDAVDALDVGLSGAPDAEVLETAASERRALTVQWLPR
jgi:predicted nuclease of predicted toxin-antitoxin system